MPAGKLACYIQCRCWTPPSLTRAIAVIDTFVQRPQREENAMTMHATTQLCPICSETNLQHVHCAHPGCTFLVTTCPKCDREQAVRAFVADHEEDCDRRKTTPFTRVSQPTLQFRKVA